MPAAVFDPAVWIDAIIVLTLVEALALIVYHARTGKGVAPADFLINLVSGLALMLALRGAVSDDASSSAGKVWIAGCLAAAGLAHATDLWRRWRR